MIEIAVITKVSARPDAWRGIAADGRPLYMLLNDGALLAYLGAPHQRFATMDDELVSTRTLEPDTKTLSYRLLREFTRVELGLPTFETPVTDEVAQTLCDHHAEAAREEYATGSHGPAAYQRVSADTYWNGQSLLVVPHMREFDDMLCASKEHDCRKMGCPSIGHVLLMKIAPANSGFGVSPLKGESLPSVTKR